MQLRVLSISQNKALFQKPFFEGETYRSSGGSGSTSSRNRAARLPIAAALRET